MISESLKKKLAAYTTLGAAYLAGSSKADAQMVYTDVNPDSPIFFSYDGYHLDLNNDGVTDFVFHHYHSQSGSSLASYQGESFDNFEIEAKSNNGVVSYDGHPAQLEASDTIDASKPFFDGGDFRVVSGGWDAAPNYNGTGWDVNTWKDTINYWDPGIHYLGLKLIDAGKTYYGWARISVDSGKRLVTPDGSLGAT